MTTETLASSDDDRPRRRPPGWAVGVAALVVLAVVITGLVVQRHRADEGRAVRLTALDDGNLQTRVTGGGTGQDGVQLEIAITNAGAHSVVLGEVASTVPGVKVARSTLAGRSLGAGFTLTDELQLNVTCPIAADSRAGGQLFIPFTTAAHRRHVLRVTLDADPKSPDSEAMNIIRSQCGAIDAAAATDLGVLELVARQQQIDITAELTNSGRSRLSVQAIRLADERLRLVVVPRLPLSIEARGKVGIRLQVTVAECGPEINHDGSTFSVVSSNEYGDSDATTSDDRLDRAFRKLVAQHCPHG